QSWGGYLAQEVALTQPPGLRSLILADTAASVPDFVAECDRLRADLPPDVEAVLRRHEADGTTDDPAYREACRAFDLRHLCRLEPWPDELLTTLAKTEEDPTVYEIMNGPSDFFVTGSLRDWQCKDRLAEIGVPTLIISGRYDQMTPALQEELHAGIPQSQWVLFEASSHLPHLEERQSFMNVAGSWLDQADCAHSEPAGHGSPEDR
ncbi:MAG: proline iminopeptidase-family hydrolase, partial [Thermoplasmata archaeon]|nr:proline iminopeptidase-family hydrolase [Thermoplasmata archaeon]